MKNYGKITDNKDVTTKEFVDAQVGTKQDTISDLSTIRSGAALGATALQPNSAITAGTATKVTYDAKGLITSGTTLAASDIPNLDAAKITSGTFADARIASASIWNAKQAAITGAATTITSSDLTASRALISNGSGKVAVSDITSTELNYLDGVTSNIQTQLNNKEAADATILKKANVVDNVTTTTTNIPLSANQGKLLNDRINNLESVGRFLSIWNCITGKPTSDPTTLPYAYKTGDYYRVGVVAATGGTNYKPSGQSYTGAASTTQETATVDIGYIYYYDGSIWTLQAGSPEGKVQDVQVDDVSTLSGGIAKITLGSFGVTATASELNTLDGITATTTELNYTDGVTSNIQTQIDNIGNVRIGTTTSGHANGVILNDLTNNVASGNYSIAEGNRTTASATGAHAEGYYTIASGAYSHAEGGKNGASSEASGYASHVEGISNIASGGASHAEGIFTVAGSTYATHTEGYGTQALSDLQHVEGSYNITDSNSTYVHIIGNGEDDNTRSNAHTVDWSGNAWYSGNIKVGGTSYTDVNAKQLATQDYVTTAVSGKQDTLVSGTNIKTINNTTILGSGDISTPDTKNTAGSTDTSSKIYLIGATEQSANPQTYSDDQVYVENGTLKAPIFSGTLTGNATSATTATKLKSNRTIALGTGVIGTATAFDGSSNITIPVTEVKEGYLSWGGQHITGKTSPLGMAISNEHNANRMAYINGDAITMEYSSDAGSTWTDYGHGAASKSWFFTSGLDLPVGRPSTSTAYTLDSRTRITITAQNGTNGYVYTDPRKMLLQVSTACGLQVLIETRTGANYQSEGSWSTFGTYAVSGWSGWNDIPLVLSTLGGATSQLANIWQLRLTFSVTSVSSSSSTHCNVRACRIYGTNLWTSPSTLATNGHMYTIDTAQNVTFPAEVRDSSGYKLENTGNKVTSISSSSTDTQYPTAKAVYNIVGNIEAALIAIRGV